MRAHSLALAAALSLASALPAVAQDYEVGTLKIEQPWTRATPPGAKAGAGFLKITNTGDTADRLIAADSPIAQETEIHTMTVIDGVMKMRPLADGIEIPAGGTIELKPGGYHLMFIGLNEPIAEGEPVTADLAFDKAGEVEVLLTVVPPGAPGPKGGHGAMGDGHGNMNMPNASE